MHIFKAPNNDTFRAPSAEGLPEGCVRITEEELAEVLASRTVVPVRSTADTIRDFTNSIQQRLDAFAQSRGYDNITNACTYANSKHANFAAEGRRCADLRDDTWAAAYVILEEVLAGTRAVPQGIEDIAADLPTLTWL
jgi:hypothetical protein